MALDDKARRDFLRISVTIGAGLVLSSCSSDNKEPSNPQEKKDEASKKDGDKKEAEVTATEDLMREHGILRRSLLVYSAVATKLRNKPTDIPPDVLLKTTKLFRAFGEDYHEKKLEETYIFPNVKKAGGVAANYIDVLLAQHQRSREITDYILALAQSNKLGASNAEILAKTLDAFVLMYEHHTAREDTIIFPAWKQTLTAKQLDEMGEKFEDIEHEQFGKDGFDDALDQITDIEKIVGLSDISQFTAPPPPKI